MITIRTLDQLSIPAGARVFYRVDYNVPLAESDTGTRITDADPWLSLFFDSKEIPDPATGNKGTNFAHYRGMDDLLVA